MEEVINMNDMSTKRVNLRGMIHLDQMEEFLSRLLDRIAEQDKQIQKLQIGLSNSLTKTQGLEQFHGLQQEMEMIRKRLDAVEESCMSKVGNQLIPAGKLASENYIQLQSLQSLSENFILRSEVHQNLHRMKENINEEIKKLYEWATPLDLSLKIQQLQLDLTSRLHNVENTLQLKVDKSDITHVEVLATRLRSYDSFKEETENSILTMNRSINDLYHTSHSHSVELSNTRDECKRIDRMMNQFAPLSELSETNKQLNVNTILIQSLGQEVNEMVQTKIKNCEDEIRLLNQHATKTNHKFDEIKIDLDLKAPLADLKYYVLRKHYEEAVTELRSVIDKKSTIESLNVSNSRIQELETNLEAEQRKVAVAVRFVEWFVERGASYEQNMQVLDKHIGNLAKANHPSSRQPFTGQIRYTPVMDNFKGPVGEKNSVLKTDM